MIIEVIKCAIDHWNSLHRIRYFRINGLKEGSEVTIIRLTGIYDIVSAVGKEKHGLFISTVEYQESRNYQIIVRCPGYANLSIPATGPDMTVRMKKDAYYA